MEQARTFPTAGVELRYLLVASDYARSLAFYRDVLGARVVREISEVLCLLSFGGAEILLTVGGGPTKDKPTVAFAPPTDADRVSSRAKLVNTSKPRLPQTYFALMSSHFVIPS